MIASGNVVEEFDIGNVHVKICDDAYRDKTPEDIQKVLDDVAEIVTNHYISKAMKEKER